jgi:hypothetical protein
VLRVLFPALYTTLSSPLIYSYPISPTHPLAEIIRAANLGELGPLEARVGGSLQALGAQASYFGFVVVLVFVLFFDFASSGQELKAGK